MRERFKLVARTALDNINQILHQCVVQAHAVEKHFIDVPNLRFDRCSRRFSLRFRFSFRLREKRCQLPGIKAVIFLLWNLRAFRFGAHAHKGRYACFLDLRKQLGCPGICILRRQCDAGRCLARTLAQFGKIAQIRFD